MFLLIKKTSHSISCKDIICRLLNYFPRFSVLMNTNKIRIFCFSTHFLLDLLEQFYDGTTNYSKVNKNNCQIERERKRREQILIFASNIFPLYMEYIFSVSYNKTQIKKKLRILKKRRREKVLCRKHHLMSIFMLIRMQYSFDVYSQEILSKVIRLNTIHCCYFKLYFYSVLFDV